MALKTFNLNEEIYKQFSDHCKKNGISMSKKVENFIRRELAQIKPPTFRPKTQKTIPIENHPLSKYV